MVIRKYLSLEEKLKLPVCELPLPDATKKALSGYDNLGDILDNYRVISKAGGTSEYDAKAVSCLVDNLFFGGEGISGKIGYYNSLSDSTRQRIRSYVGKMA
jgi:hypothetical protein